MSEETETDEVKEKRKRRPGGGRKKKSGTIYKEASEKFQAAAPELAEALINRAIGAPVEITCPGCGHEFKFKIPGAQGDAKLLEYANDRVHGKPVAKQEIDLTAKVELSNQKLAQLHVLVLQTDREVQAIDTSDLKRQILIAPVDDTGNKELEIIDG